MTALASGESPRRVLAIGVACYLLWGVMPLLFIVLGQRGASAWEIVGQRAVWSAPCAGLLVLAAGQGGQVWRLLRTPRLLGLLAVSAASIGSGWAVYVWAVNHGHNLEASLGYYINPLMNMAAGAILFRERMTRTGLAAVALAVIGVVIQTVALGHPPVIALYLAATFWVYGLIRRQIDADAQAGLFVECLLMAAPGVAYVLWLGHTGGAVFGRSLDVSLLTILVGPATVIPLALFSWSARRLPLSSMAFLQFISPTIGFFIGWARGESLTPLRVASFIFIWISVVIFAFGAWSATRGVPSATVG